MVFNLTPNSLEAIMTDGPVDKPILQVLGIKSIKKIQSANGPDRYRLLLSDGVHSVSSAMLATQLNDKVKTGGIEANAIIRLDKHICNALNGEKKVVVLLEVTVVAPTSQVTTKIGNPQPYKQATHVQPQQNPINTPAPVNNLNTTKNINTTQNSKPMNQQFVQSSLTSQMNTMSGPQIDTPSKINLISSLTPCQSRWTIKARVTQKSSIRTWSNAKGEGRLFSMNLLDESGEIRATAFTNEVDKFYNMIEVNKVYYIRKAQIKAANKQYSNLSNDYEMSFTGETEVIRCEESESNDMPSLKFNFVTINAMETLQPESLIDVIGVVKDCEDLKIVISKKDGKEIKKRDVTLVDQTYIQIRLTVWGTDAENFDGTGNPILAAKGCKLSDWQGRSLSQVANCQLLINPDIPESHALRGWFDKMGASADFMEYKRDSAGQTGGNTVWKSFEDVKAQNLGADKSDYFNVKAAISTVKKENCLYTACPQPECNKKVIDQGNGMFRCEKCAREYPNFKWRLILQLCLSDIRDNLWVTCFQDSAELILNSTAEEIGRLKEINPSEFDQIFNNAVLNSYIFKLRAKMESYNDEARLKTVCVQATPLSFKAVGNRFMDEFERHFGLV